ncbi:MAG: mannose-6-phosphate isomerase, class I [Acidimicrobiales bacterium]
MLPLVGSVQRYDWGATDAIPALLGVPPDGTPQAEWWLGTHPVAPSRAVVDGVERSLAQVAGGPLPYLVKVLAAAAPLSLQTHPSKAQAEAGFAREDAAGIARDAPNRTYRDDNHKPELLVALEPFDALCGLRRPGPLADRLAGLACPALDPVIGALRGPDGLRTAVEWLWRRPADEAAAIARAVAGACAGRDEPDARWVVRLTKRYPDDIGAVLALCCNLVRLAPGEAIFLGPGNLHAYLHGVGVEVMASSDNVLRGGLTTKYVDVEALLEVVEFEPLDDPVIRPVALDHARQRYEVPVPDFAVERVTVTPGRPVTWTAAGPEILVVVDGSVDGLARGAAAYLSPGEVVTLVGEGVVFRTA